VYPLYSFTYNGTGQLITDSVYDSAAAVAQYTTYSYDAGGNVTAIEDFTFYQVSFTDLVNGPTTYTFDMHVNPYYGSVGKLLFVTGSPSGPLYLSKANYTKAIPPGIAVAGAQNYYTYYSNGLPQTIYYTVPPPLPVVKYYKAP